VLSDSNCVVLELLKRLKHMFIAKKVYKKEVYCKLLTWVDWIWDSLVF